MIIISDATAKMFVRLQLATGIKREECVETLTKLSGGLFSLSEIEDWSNRIYAEGHQHNNKVIEKMMGMMKEFIIPDYVGHCIDDDGCDEADRFLMEIIESVGNLDGY